jgi:hypothetical protein
MAKRALYDLPKPHALSIIDQQLAAPSALNLHSPDDALISATVAAIQI